jgi:rod shape-determining protein MreD
MSIPIKFLLNFCVLLFFQLFFLNDILIKSSITLFGIPAFIPIIYPLILLVLPVNTPNWLGMLLGFFTGLVVDYFCNTPGMHAASCVLLCYLRPALLGLFFQQSIKELGSIVPSIFRMGFTSFLIYCGTAIFLHHLFFYILQIWSLKNFHIILFKTFLSGIVSVLLIVISQLLFAQKEIKRI